MEICFIGLGILAFDLFDNNQFEKQSALKIVSPHYTCHQIDQWYLQHEIPKENSIHQNYFGII